MNNLKILVLLFCLSLEAQDYNSTLSLKDYANSTVITSQVRSERNKAILRGTEADSNRAFVLVPMYEIDKEIKVPLLGSIKKIIDRVNTQDLKKL